MSGDGTGADAFRTTVRPEWTDHNDHLNVAYYALIFDQATDHFFDRFGAGADYARRTACSTFAIEAHTRYLNEVRSGEDVLVTSSLLGVDDKRVRYAHRLIRKSDNALAATLEQVSIHVDLDERRVRPWPDVLKNQFGAAQVRDPSFNRLGLKAPSTEAGR